LPQFYTAYTPYQPEVSQGTLQAIYEFQSLMTNLTEMDLTNASMYDGATSTAEAMIMVCQHQRKNKVLISTLLHPYLTEVLKTYAEMRQIELIPVSADEGSISYPELERLAKEDPAMLIIQSPNVFGIIEELEPVCTMLKARKIATLAAVLEPLSLAIIKTPGACGVDVTTGEAQSFGIAPSYGGPGLGFFSTRKEYIRKIPGRIVGKTTDDQQRTAYVMTLRAREQDIRREKASSNICTNHALCALQATIYLSTLGEIGLKKLAQRNLQLSHKAFEALLGIPGIRAPFKKPFFNEFLIEIDQDLQKVKETSIKHKILLSKTDLSKTFPYLKNPILLNLTELNSEQDIEKLVEAFKEALK
jgi:glycine dehydrogenase subunit 1